MPADFTDDKLSTCIPFILKHLGAHRQATTRPLFIGLNGPQGVGKTTLVALLTTALESLHIPTLVCSIDDFYLPHAAQILLAQANPNNALWQHRGEPGTHEVALAKAFFTSLLARDPARLPRYDKAAFSGQGDRLPVSSWDLVHGTNVQVVILEGWCVGFRALDDLSLRAAYDAPSLTLRRHRMEDLVAINHALGDYDALTDLLDAFIHIDAEDLAYVYEWRQEQEDHLREKLGDPAAGMTRDQVVKFVDAYFPGYELYVPGVRAGVFPPRSGAQLRLIVGRDRRVKQVIEI